MALVRFTDLVMDVVDPATLTPLWGRWLGLRAEIDEHGGVLRGDRPEQTIWVDRAEPKRTKNRVHLDLVAADLTPFAEATRLTEPGRFSWTTFADPDGAEFCVFEIADRPAGLKDVVVDCGDHAAIGRWWAEVIGGDMDTDGRYTWLDRIPGAPVESFDFVPVPEPKTVKNRVHWDVTLLPGVTVDDLVDQGATVLTEPSDVSPWTVMADPEGNEFCVFPAD